MNSTVRNTLGGLLLVGLAVATWLLGRPSLQEGPRPGAAGAGASGYYLREATLFGTDTEGRIRYRLNAARIDRPADGGNLTFEDLRVEYDPAFDVHWRLSAGAGVAGIEPGQLALHGGVRLETRASGAASPTRIETQTLTLNTSASTATTRDRVALENGRTRFEATGMSADLANDRIDLHADVSANILP